MTFAELKSRTLQRLGDDPDVDPSLMYYQPSEVASALNRAQRFFVLFTLCLETTAAFPLDGSAFYHALESFSDWIVPLRVRNAANAKVKPCALSDLAALDNRWTRKEGMPERYALSGFDLLGVYKQDSSTLSITYARGPVAMVADDDEPEIPIEQHPSLIDGAIPILRTKEGQQEWQKVLPRWDAFLEAVQKVAERVRNRNREQGYDSLPPELKRLDMSHVKGL